jgi:hypothetical protein
MKQGNGRCGGSFGHCTVIKCKERKKLNREMKGFLVK